MFEYHLTASVSLLTVAPKSNTTFFARKTLPRVKSTGKYAECSVVCEVEGNQQSLNSTSRWQKKIIYDSDLLNYWVVWLETIPTTVTLKVQKDDLEAFRRPTSAESVKWRCTAVYSLTRVARSPTFSPGDSSDLLPLVQYKTVPVWNPLQEFFQVSKSGAADGVFIRTLEQRFKF